MLKIRSIGHIARGMTAMVMALAITLTLIPYTVKADIINGSGDNTPSVSIVDYETSTVDKYTVKYLWNYEAPVGIDDMSEEGITFDVDTNTLTLNNCVQPAYLIEYISGSNSGVGNFYINVTGNCKVKGIDVKGDNLIITGNGVLEVNAPTDISMPALDVDSAVIMRTLYGNDNDFYVRNSATVKLYGYGGQTGSVIKYMDRNTADKELYLSYEGNISEEPSWKDETADNIYTYEESFYNLNVLMDVPKERVYKHKNDSSGQYYVKADRTADEDYPYDEYTLKCIEGSYYTSTVDDNDWSVSYSSSCSEEYFESIYEQLTQYPAGMNENGNTVSLYLPVADNGAPLSSTKWKKADEDKEYILLAKNTLSCSAASASASLPDTWNKNYYYCLGTLESVYDSGLLCRAYYVKDLEEVSVEVQDDAFDFSSDGYADAKDKAETNLKKWMEEYGYEAVMNTDDYPDTYTFYVVNETLTFTPDEAYGTLNVAGASAHISSDNPFDPDGYEIAAKRFLTASTKTVDSTAIYYGTGAPAGNIDGIEYDAATNTATITDAELETLRGTGMGTDFKLKLVGDSTIEHIDMINSSLIITGSGSLIVNGEKNNDSAIEITEENGEQGTFNVKKGAVLYLYAKDGQDVVKLNNTSAADNAVTLPSEDVQIEKKEVEAYEDTNPFYVHYLPYSSSGIHTPTSLLIKCRFKGDTTHTLYGAQDIKNEIGDTAATTYEIFKLTYIYREGIYHAKRVAVDGKLRIDEDTFNEYFDNEGENVDDRAKSVDYPHAGRLCESKSDGKVYGYTITDDPSTTSVACYGCYDIYSYDEIEDGYYFEKSDVFMGTKEEFESKYTIKASTVPCYTYTLKGSELKLGHIHVYDSEWVSDDTNHWHECVDNDKTITDKAEHTSSDWIYEGEYHWKECTVCGSVIGSRELHAWGEGVETTPATYEKEGVRTYTCKCGATRTELVDKLVNDKNEEGETGKTGNDVSSPGDVKQDTGTSSLGGDKQDTGTSSLGGDKQDTDTSSSGEDKQVTDMAVPGDDGKKTDTDSGTAGSGDNTSVSTDIAEGTKTEDTSGATYTVTETAAGSESGTVEVEYTAPSATSEKSITIPATVEVNGVTATVTSIADSAFENNKTMTAVSIPGTVEEIGDSAFKNCTKLKSVTLPESVETVGKNAFSGCSSLTKVNVKGSGLAKVDQGAFKNCKKLKTVTLPKSVTSIGKEAFAGDKSLKTITIKSTKLKSVGKNAFKNVPKSTTIKVPKKQKKAYTKLLRKAGFKGKIK